MRTTESHHCRSFRGTTLTLLALLLLATGSAVAYYLLWEEEPEPLPRTEAQDLLLDQFARQLAEWVEDWDVTDQKAYIAGFTRDRNGEVAEVTRRILLLSDRYFLVPEGRPILPWQARRTRPAPPTSEEAVRQGRLHDAGIVIWGTVEEFSHTTDTARLKVTVGRYDATNWKLIDQRSFSLSHTAKSTSGNEVERRSQPKEGTAGSSPPAGSSATTPQE